MKTMTESDRNCHPGQIRTFLSLSFSLISYSVSLFYNLNSGLLLLPF